uniref:Uncharacterized protein n=1 Tax=Avena sativa TaxID=4498 RepID=A0ACD5XII7_AVESA
MAAYYNGGRTMSYSNDGCYDGGRTMYSNTTEECYDAPKHGHGHGHEHGHGHGHGMTNMYSNTTTDECYDAGKHGHRGMNMYTNTTDVECFEGGRHGHGHGHGHDGGRAMSYSTSTEEECYGGAQGQMQQGYYKKEEKTHQNRERMGEVGALATGAFALYEGYEAKKDPAHAQKHKIEAGLAGAAALGAGGYAYHEHREQKQASYGAGGAHRQEYRMPVQNHYCN